MILIVTANGNLGSAVARRLLAQNYPVRGLVRSAEKGEEMRDLGAEIVIGDLRDPPSLALACRGVDQVLAAAHSILGKGPDASKYVDLQGNKNLVDAAEAAGVQHFVFMSGFAGEEAMYAVPFFRIKREVELYVQTSGLHHTILRPTAFMESHAEMFIGKSIMETGKASLLGKGENPRNFVAVNDVAQIVFTVLTEPARQGGIIAVGGPENRTNMEVVRLYEQQLGRPVKVSHLPVAALQLIYRVLRPFNAGLSQIMQAGIVIDTTDQTFDPGEMLQTFPLELTTLEEFIASRTGEYQTAV